MITAFNRYGGSGASINGSSDIWAPPVDWPDIKTIMNQDTDSNLRGIFLFADIALKKDITLDTYYFGNANSVLKTFDNQAVSYGSAIPWNSSQDISCSEGYKTRWIKLYDSSGSINLRDMARYPILYGIVKNCSLLSFYGSYSNTLRCIEMNNVTLSDSLMGDGLFREARKLEKLELPEGIVDTRSHICFECRSLKYVKLPNSLRTIGVSAFDNTSIEELTIPNTITTLGNYFMANSYVNRKIKIGTGALTYSGTAVLAGIRNGTAIEIPQGYVMPANNMSEVTHETLSVSWFIDFCNRLGTAPSTRTITFGTEFMNKVRSTTGGTAAISVASGKRYTFN